MHPETLFLYRCAKLEALCETNSELEMLDIAGILRQLLFDKTSLADAANLNNVPLRFAIRNPPHAYSTGYEAGNGGERPVTYFAYYGTLVDTAMPPPESEISYVGRADFGKLEIGQVYGRPFTVKQVIKLCANAQGGIHYDANLVEELAVFFPDGKPPPEYSHPQVTSMYSVLVAMIGRVVLEGLQPLIADVRTRHP